jgi:hypothetical protein
LNEKLRFLDIHYELPVDLQRVLDDDLVLLQQQIENIKLEQLHSELKSTCDRIEKQQPIHRALAIPFFAGQNAPSGIDPFNPISSSIHLLSRFGNRQTCCRSNDTNLKSLCIKNSFH